MSSCILYSFIIHLNVFILFILDSQTRLDCQKLQVLNAPSLVIDLTFEKPQASRGSVETVPGICSHMAWCQFVQQRSMTCPGCKHVPWLYLAGVSGTSQLMFGSRLGTAAVCVCVCFHGLGMKRDVSICTKSGLCCIWRLASTLSAMKHGAAELHLAAP